MSSAGQAGPAPATTLPPRFQQGVEPGDDLADVHLPFPLHRNVSAAAAAAAAASAAVASADGGGAYVVIAAVVGKRRHGGSPRTVVRSH